MKNYFKKLSIMFVMALMLVVGCATSAYATDDGVVGTSNLNNTANNSAKVGDALLCPEIGWKRYDDTNSKISYVGTWSTNTSSNYYNGVWHYCYDNNSKIKVKFYGTKFRAIGNIASTTINRGKIINVKIDDMFDSSFSQVGATGYQSFTQVLNYEKLGLSEGIHTVEIQLDQSEATGTYLILDAIDIDKTGQLVNPNESITLDKSSMNLKAGDSGQLTATTTPSGAQVTWTSSDPSIATVDSTGKVTGIKEGQATITAKTADGEAATCTVTVTNGESISLNKPVLDLITGDSGTLIATTTPSGVNVKWSSSNTSIATVDSSGKVTAIGVGTATITATTTDGSNLSASSTINVASKGTEPIPESTDSDKIVNIAHAKGDNTNNAGGGVTIIFKGIAEAQLSVVKTADVDSVYVGDVFTYTIVVTNTSTKTAKAVVVNDIAPNHIDFNVSGITTTQGKVDPSSTSKNIIVNIGDILPSGKVTIKIPATVIF